MDYILLAVSVFLGLSKNIVSKKYKSAFDGLDNLLLSNIVTAVLAVIVFGSLGIDQSLLKNTSILFMASVFGILTMLSQMLYITAVKKGSVTICSLIYSCGFLIPTVFGTLYYHEKVSVFRCMGVLLLILGILAVTGKITRPNSKQSLIPAAFAMVCSGGVGVLQKIFRTESPEGDVNTFLCLAFIAMLIISTILKLFHNRSREKIVPDKKIVVFGAWIVLAVSVVFANKLNLYLSGVLKGAVFFPCVNGGCIAATAMVSCLLLKEKLSTVQWLGVGCTVVSIVLIAL